MPNRNFKKIVDSYYTFIDVTGCNEYNNKFDVKDVIEFIANENGLDSENNAVKAIGNNLLDLWESLDFIENIGKSRYRCIEGIRDEEDYNIEDINDFNEKDDDFDDSYMRNYYDRYDRNFYPAYQVSEKCGSKRKKRVVKESDDNGSAYDFFKPIGIEIVKEYKLTDEDFEEETYTALFEAVYNYITGFVTEKDYEELKRRLDREDAEFDELVIDCVEMLLTMKDDGEFDVVSEKCGGRKKAIKEGKEKFYKVFPRSSDKFTDLCLRMISNIENEYEEGTDLREIVRDEIDARMIYDDDIWNVYREYYRPADLREYPELIDLLTDDLMKCLDVEEKEIEEKEIEESKKKIQK